VTAAHFLLSNGANPSVADKNGRTPLHWAALLAKDMNIVGLLLNHKGTNVNYLDNEGNDALHYAMKNIHGLSERIANRLKEKGFARVEEKIFQADLLDECTGGKATGHSLDNNNYKNENETESLEKAALYKVVVDSDGNKTLSSPLIKKGAELDKGKCDEMHLTYRYAEMKGIVDNLLTVLYGTTAPNCTSDAIDENLLKELLENAIVHTDVEKIRILIEMGADLSKTTWGGGRNALHAASIGAKTTEILDVILATGEFDINGPDAGGETALHFALRAKNMKTARHLFEKGAAPTIRDHKGNTPFHTAAALSREIDILDLFLADNDKFDIDHRNQFGMTALHRAVMESNRATAGFLLSKGANPNAADQNGVTPLHLAAYFANMQICMDIVKLLLNHKDTNVNYLDNVGRNVLHYAQFNKYGLGEAIADLLREKRAPKAEGIKHKPKNIAAPIPDRIQEDSDIKTIRFLIENGQDISALTWGEDGANALHVAAANEKTTEFIDAILETGKFDINGVDGNGWTPLHHAIMGSCSTKIVPHLIQLGADPNIAGQYGITPLHLAAKNEETTELIDVILETEQCNINPVDSDGRTPLHYAIKRPDPVTINARRLIKMGADPGIADKNGVTPLHMAARNAESMDLIELLLNTEAVDVNCVDKQGQTPLACARDNTHGLAERIIARLREYDDME
jgi:ankyrin repeat protein